MSTDTLSPIETLVLARVFCTRNPSRSDCARALNPYGESTDGVLDALAGRELLVATPLRLTTLGEQRLRERIHFRQQNAPRWSALHNRHLLAAALGIVPTSDTEWKRIASADGLRSAILVRHYGLPTTPVPTLPRALTLLAWQQLQQPHQVTWNASTPFDRNAVLKVTLLDNQSGPPERVLPARIVGAANTSPAALRTAIFERWLQRPTPSSAEENDEFAAQVRQAARACETGRYGESKVFISHVWRQFQTVRKTQLSRAQFDDRLIEANRTGRLALSRADLVSAMPAEDIAESEIGLPHTKFHFVRTD